MKATLGFDTWQSLILHGAFVTGTNTLDFVVTNTAPSFAGLRVEYTDLTLS